MSSSDLDDMAVAASALGEDLDDVVVLPGNGEHVPLLAATSTSAPSGYDAVEPCSVAATASPSAKDKKAKDKDKDKDKDKKIKSGQKMVADALKTEMAAERTFFKWLWTGLHTGAIGTFIFVTFDNNKDDPYRIAVVAFAWFVAFGLVLYGLYAYNRRRTALREGRLEVMPLATREYGPCIVVVAIGLVVGSGLLYAVFSGNPPQHGKFAGV
jgi:uncharacterized membrane protein YidH (DUF202 family)